MNENIERMVKELNKSSHRKDLFVPIIDNFEKIESTNDVVFMAKSKDNFTEILFEDKKISSIENLTDRISALVNESKHDLRKNNVQVDVAKLKILNVNNIDYYLYIQKASINNKTNMQINAYFLEPKNRVIYQLSILSPTYDNSMFIDKYEMNLTMKLISIIETVINNIKIKQ